MCIDLYFKWILNNFMIKKQGFILLFILLILFIATQLITDIIGIPVSVNPNSMVNTSKMNPQKLFEKTWKEVRTEFYDSSLNSQDWNYWKKHYKGKIKNIVLRMYSLSINRKRDKRALRRGGCIF